MNEEVLVIAENLHKTLCDQVLSTEQIKNRYSEPVKDDIETIKNFLNADRVVVKRIIQKSIEADKKHNWEFGKLKEEITLINERVDEQKRLSQAEIRELRTTQENMQRELEQMHNDVVQMQDIVVETQMRLNEMQGPLERWQLMFDFERHLAYHVYPTGFVFSPANVYQDLTEWLGNNQHELERREAIQRWDNVMRGRHWSDAHENVIYKVIREGGRPTPSLTYTPEEEDFIEDIRSILQWLIEH